MTLFAVAFYVVHITLEEVGHLQAPFPGLNLLAPGSETIFSFYKCNITEMCNINFDADRETTPGTEQEGQWRRILFRSTRGVVLIFLSCIVIFIL